MTQKIKIGSIAIGVHGFSVHLEKKVFEKLAQGSHEIFIKEIGVKK